MKRAKIMFAIFSVGLTGCQSISDFALMGTGVGADTDALYGNAIARTMGDDYYSSNGAFVKATRVAVGDTVYWQNGRTGTWGSYCPIREGHTRIYGDYCREMMATVYVNNRIQRIYSTACRRPNGTWYSI